MILLILNEAFSVKKKKKVFRVTDSRILVLSLSSQDDG